MKHVDVFKRLVADGWKVTPTPDMPEGTYTIEPVEHRAIILDGDESVVSDCITKIERLYRIITQLSDNLDKMSNLHNKMFDHVIRLHDRKGK